MQGFANFIVPIIILLILIFILTTFEDLLKTMFDKFKEWCIIKDLLVEIAANIILGALQI
jgi:hypothetical protein